MPLPQQLFPSHPSQWRGTLGRIGVLYFLQKGLSTSGTLPRTEQGTGLATQLTQGREPTLSEEPRAPDAAHSFPFGAVTGSCQSGPWSFKILSKSERSVN